MFSFWNYSQVHYIDLVNCIFGENVIQRFEFCFLGKSPTHQQLSEEGVDLPRWVSSISEQQSTSDVFDPELTRYQDGDNENMIRLLKIGISCTAQYPDSRPTMPEVTRLIEEVSRSSGSPGPLSD